MRIILSIFSTFLILGCEDKMDQRLEVVKFDALERIMTTESNQVEVINFWATWCKPCIKELPYFLELNDNANVNVTLVSLDFADEFDKKVIPFVEEENIKADVILLDEIDYNSWIDKIDPSWSGAIPATLVINHRTGKRKFIEKELEEGEIELIVKEVSN